MNADSDARAAALGPVDLLRADLQMTCSIYEGFSTAIVVRGQPRTVALCREYGDAVQLMSLIDAARAALAPPEGAVASAPAGRTFSDPKSQAAYDLFRREGWMRGDIERFYRQGYEGVSKPEQGSPRGAVWWAGRDRAEAGLPSGIPEFVHPHDGASAPVEGGAYADQAVSDLMTVLGRLTSDWPNHADYDVALPAGHWRAIADRLAALQAQGEPVAKRIRWGPDDDWDISDWADDPLTNDDVARLRSKGHEVELLYAHPPASADGWRPIESAPKDGTNFDGWQRDERVTDMFWSAVQDAWCIDGTYGPEEPTPLAIYPPVTHWRPLPEPPRPAAEGRALQPEGGR